MALVEDWPTRPAELRSVSPASLGVPLLALLNGSSSQDTALISWDGQDDSLNACYQRPIDAFAAAIAMRRRNRKSRIDEYPSSQAKQLLGDAFERQRPPKKEMRAWVPTEKRGDAMRIVANEVINQKGVSPDRAIEALGLMQEEYVRFLPTLEGSDRAHSTSSERTVFVEDMAELFRGAGRG